MKKERDTDVCYICVVGKKDKQVKQGYRLARIFICEECAVRFSDELLEIIDRYWGE